MIVRACVHVCARTRLCVHHALTYLLSYALCTQVGSSGVGHQVAYTRAEGWQASSTSADFRTIWIELLRFR